MPDSSTESDLKLADLEGQHAREHYRLYRTKAYGPRLTSPGRLRELELRSEWAAIRLDRATASTPSRRSTADAAGS